MLVMEACHESSIDKYEFSLEIMHDLRLFLHWSEVFNIYTNFPGQRACQDIRDCNETL